MKKHFYFGLLLMVMGMVELSTLFMGLPGLMAYAGAQPEWYYQYVPVICLVNGLIACVMLMYAGVNHAKKGTPDPTKRMQSSRFVKYIIRRLEKKKYGYVRSEYK